LFDSAIQLILENKSNVSIFICLKVRFYKQGIYEAYFSYFLRRSSKT
jgi:hypothetical protein